MLTLYRTSACPRCTDVQDALENLAIAHRVIEVRGSDDLPDPLRGKHALPVLVDDGAIIQGSGPILDHLEQLAEFKELWYKYQSDACYCDAEGNPE